MRRFAVPIALVALLAGCSDPEAGGSGGVSTAGPYVPTPAEATVHPDLTGAALLDALDRDYSPARTLGYGRARDVLFVYEQDRTGSLEAVYSGFTVVLPPDEDPTVAADRLGVNTEHVWPQSYGAHDEPLRSDMHHLFAERANVNASRGNLPFGEIDDRETDAWYRLDASQSNAPSADRDLWSERGDGRFEPRESREGDIARAVFYVYAVYRPEVDAAGGAPFFESMRADLLEWNDLDPPDAAEIARTAWIAEQQGTPNPFVLDPTLARRAFGGAASGPPPRGPEAADLWVSEIHYDNVGEDVGEGVEVAGEAGARLDGWRLVLYNGDSGAAYRTLPLSGTVPASGAVWVPAAGLQNGSPDGLALVAPSGEVAVFLSYEGSFSATDGPAQGRTSTDIQAQETGSTPAGRSLHLESGTWIEADATPGRR